MEHRHSRDGEEAPAPRRPGLSTTTAVLLGAVVVLIAATVAALILLWPHGHVRRLASIVGVQTLGAKVVAVADRSCAIAVGQRCRTVTARLLDGREKGRTASFEIVPTPGLSDIRVGDQIRVIRTPTPPPGSPSTIKVPPYSFSDFDRRMPMLWLGIGFVILLLASGRLHGLRALVGLAASLLVVLKFVIPAIIDGHSAVAVALTGSLAVLLITIPLSYGIRAKAIAAWLGTALALLLAVGLAYGFTHLAHLSGASSEEAVFLSASDRQISLQGLLLAGMVIGALGVLVDLTVSQASTVIALQRANRSLGFRGLFGGALDVGHDHIAATVNTLVFAYAGAALPVLLIFSIGGTTFTDAVNSESVAAEIISTLVGSIGLVASMPITTALAALLALRLEGTRLGQPLAEAHAHVH